MSCVYGVPPIILHVHTLTFPPFSTFSRSVRVANGTDERRERRNPEINAMALTLRSLRHAPSVAS